MRYDLFGGLFWFVLGAVYAAAAVYYRIGTFNVPGPGFVPFLSGGTLAVLGLSLSVSAYFAKGKEAGQGGRSEGGMKKLLLALLGLVLYAVLLDRLGFIVDTFLFLVLLFKIAGPRKWLVPIVLSAVVVAAAHLLFTVFLNTHFPAGILGY